MASSANHGHEPDPCRSTSGQQSAAWSGRPRGAGERSYFTGMYLVGMAVVNFSSSMAMEALMSENSSLRIIRW